MARYSAARDAKIYEQSHLSLKLFFDRSIERMKDLPEDATLADHIAERGLTGKEIFGADYRDQWCRRLLNGLEAGGYVLAHHAPNKSHRHGATLYLALPSLPDLLSDEASYGELLFPSGLVELPDAEEDEEPAGDAPEPTIDDALQWLSEKQSLKDLAETLVKVDVVILQNVAAIRTELTELSVKLDELLKAWR